MRMLYWTSAGNLIRGRLHRLGSKGHEYAKSKALASETGQIWMTTPIRW